MTLALAALLGFTVGWLLGAWLRRHPITQASEYIRGWTLGYEAGLKARREE